MGREPVRVVYTCFGGTHSSPVAAAIHLGILPRDRVPSVRELLTAPGFDTAEGDGRGLLRLAGVDPGGNLVYTLPRGRLPAAVVRRLMEGTLRMAGRGDVPLLVVDTLGCVGWLMRAGGFLSRRAGLVRVGRPLVALGTRRAYWCLVRLVRETEAVLAAWAAGDPGSWAGVSPNRLTSDERG